MAGGSSVAAGPSPVGARPAAPPAEKDPGRRRRYLVAAGFLLPALIFLGVWVVYPTVYTVIRSFYDAQGDAFVGIDNYQRMFTSSILLTAIKNNAIWVLVVPALVTAIGLVFAVLTERIRWSVAFKTAVFMPMAISLFAAGVIWHIMYSRTRARAPSMRRSRWSKTRSIRPAFSRARRRPRTRSRGRRRRGTPSPTASSRARWPSSGSPASRPRDVKGGQQAVKPVTQSGGITGVVWRDFKPGGGKPGKVERGEIGIPGVTLDLLNGSGKQVATTTSKRRRLVRLHRPHGRDDVPGRYRRTDVPAALRRECRG